MDSLYKRFQFFKEHSGFARVVGPETRHGAATSALWHARAEMRAEEMGLKVSWEEEDLWWEDLRGDLETERPSIWMCACVYHPDRKPDARRGDPHFYLLASLGGIGLDSWSDPYVRVVEAEVLAEALAALDEDADRKASFLAAELADRATYAGVAS